MFSLTPLPGGLATLIYVPVLRQYGLEPRLLVSLSITTATRPARYSSVELFGPLFRIPHPFAGSWNPSPGTNTRVFLYR